MLAFFGAVGGAVLAGGVLLMQQLQPAPSPAAQPGVPAAPTAPAAPATQEVDWKVKGAPTAPVLVEEWGDFQ